jgi:deazaflavin-dependent oxidoreductase (nitroreductase family)
MRITKAVRPPDGVRRTLFRLPIQVYRLGLGWMFGSRLLLLHHVGRVSGKPRLAVLEVVEHDEPSDSFVVASGWGRTAAWYRNILTTPEVTIQVGRRSIPVTAHSLTADESADIFAGYATRHRRLATYLLPRLMGYSVDGSEADFREVGRRLPFVRFVPRNRAQST